METAGGIVKPEAPIGSQSAPPRHARSVPRRARGGAIYEAVFIVSADIEKNFFDFFAEFRRGERFRQIAIRSSKPRFILPKPWAVMRMIRVSDRAGFWR